MGLIEQMDALPEDSNEGLELLRVYRMIDDMANRKVKIPEQWMTKYLQKNYPKNPDIQRQLMAHFSYAMEHVDPDLSMFDKKLQINSRNTANYHWRTVFIKTLKFWQIQNCSQPLI